VIGPFPEEEFLALHRRLALTPGPPNGEEPRRLELARFLDRHAVPHRTDPAGNLIVVLGDGPWSAAAVLDAHLDVVERGAAREVVNDGECLRGLGVADNQAAVAMLALAAVRLAPRATGLKRPLVFLFSVGEEGFGNLRGVRQFVADHSEPPYVFLAFDGRREGHSLTGVGSLRYQLRVATPGGHSWGNFGAPNAIEAALDFLAAARAAFAKARDRDQGKTSFNIGNISGGQGINSIARTAEATFEFRSVSPIILAHLAGQMPKLAARHRKRLPEANLALDLLGERPAGRQADHSRLAPILAVALGDLAGPNHEAAMSTNINVPLAHGWPAACIGLCSGEHSHREDEYLRLDSLPLGWQSLDHILEHLDATAGGQE
jgi:acetylornithine deacetylase/succinyl-diaminopimelate desuccinylase-like protein